MSMVPVWMSLICPTCVDEFDVSLKVAVDHEDLVAARVRAGPLPHLLMVLLDVLLQTQTTRQRANTKQTCLNRNT